MLITIPLTRGYSAIIDPDCAHLASHRWCAQVGKSGVVYAARKITSGDGRRFSVLLHREVLGLKPGDMMVDHINGDGLDCRRANLRTCSARDNQHNRAGPQSNNTTGYMGVYRNGSGFCAQIKIDGVAKCFGTFDTPEKANAARLAAESKLWGIQPRRKFAHEGTAT